MPLVPATDRATTGVTLPREALTLLRRVAIERAIRHGGRASVSKVLASLVEDSRARLEEEMKA